MTPIKRKDIVEYILKLLAPIEDADPELLKSIGAIAVDVLGEKKALHRATDADKIMGMIINATWKNAHEKGVSWITEAIAEAIKNNENLRDFKRENTNSKP